jgi:HEXXH motif-containing protein
MLDTHTVSLMSLDVLARGSSSPAIVEELAQVNRSKQLMLLRAVLDRVRQLTPIMTPLFPLDAAWALLIDAQQRDRAAVDLVLAHPRTGPWALHVLRRLSNAREDGPPLWAELGYLHQLATAAAIRAGNDFQSRVPVWRGNVMLPTLGLADVRSRREWDFAQVHAESGTVLVRGPAGSVQVPEDWTVDGTGWLALRALRTEGCELWFDDLDPYREFDGPVPPRRQPPPEFELWAEGLRKTWRLLSDHHPATAAELAVGMTTLAPHSAVDRFTPFSASHNDAFGAVVMSRPADPTAFAATLVHEFQHSKFGVLLSLIDLLERGADNDTPCLYAPWRDDPRPAAGVLHGLFSFLGVASFYRERCLVENGRGVRFEFAYRREQTADAAQTLLAEATPSALGRRFLATVCSHLETWAEDPLPDDVRTAAQRANLDHRLSWRLRHHRFPAAVVAELAQAWLRNRRKPTVHALPVLTPSRGTPTHPRLVLTRIWLIEPDLYEVYSAEPALAMAEVPGATAADLALINGDGGGAAELYQQQVLEHPSVTAWAGLALATGNEVLLDRPGLVSAVHQEIRARSGVATDPVRLARWLA